MIISLKKTLNNNAPLKIFSLILGTIMWSILNHRNTITIKQKVPLCFYNIPQNYALHAPETITITLAGKRSDIYTLNTKKLAIHLDAQDMQYGNNPQLLTKDTLFLPDSIKLVHYTPAPLIVEITKTQK